MDIGLFEIELDEKYEIHNAVDEEQQCKSVINFEQAADTIFHNLLVQLEAELFNLE